MTNTLICTVGGSHQPIVTAINELQPDQVIFICTDKDPATGQPGSEKQITGKGNCIKAKFSDENDNLPNIPSQTGLEVGQYQVYLTPSDDLDGIYQTCLEAIQQAYSQTPKASITADYTGGTKSMSAGLAMAAMEFPNVQLQLVTGARKDLQKVHDGQYAATANSQQIRYQRQIAPYQQAWQRYAYAEAQAGISQIKPPTSIDIRGQYNQFKDLSKAFAEWDNFNHLQATEILSIYAPKLPENYKQYLGIVQRLNNKDPQKREAARLWDLYLNAQRRAAQGRYDDAVARVYRLIEWTAQWILESQCNIKTADVAVEQIPEGVHLSQNKKGQWQAGLFNAWQLVSLKTQGAAAEFFKTQQDNLSNHLQIRNFSILAHGFEPVSAENWQAFQGWLEQQFVPMLLAETSKIGIKTIPMQLPNQYSYR
jgi:CRISPR-associated protein (TIGR02710 family)